MTEIAHLLSLGVAVIFVWAGFLKAANPEAFVEQLADYELVPQRLLRPAAALVPAAEIGGAALLVVPETRTLGAALLLGLLVIFTAISVRSIRHGRTNIRCACFGSRSQMLGWSVPLRNVLLAAPLALVWIDPSNPEVTVAAAVGAALAISLAVVLIETVRLSDLNRSLASE